MKIVYSTLLLALVLTLSVSVSAQKPDKTKLKTEIDSVSYKFGIMLGLEFKKQFPNLNIDMFAKSFNRSFNGDSVKFTQEQAQESINEYMRSEYEKKIAKKESESKKFFEENALKEGVITLPSGLQYKVLKSGEGEKPTETDQVKVHYKGNLLDGTEFDNSEKRGEAVTLGVNRVIPGWTEALQLMHPGDRWMLYVPAKLGYGERGAGPIGPNEPLIFEVELLSIEK